MRQDPPGTDETAIERFLAGDTDAFEELVERHSPGIVGALGNMVKDHHLALDLAQEVFVKLHAYLSRYRERGRFRSMLYGMALNLGRDALRQQRRSRLIFLDEEKVAQRAAPRADPAVEHERRDAIESALRRVRSPFQDALYLRDVVGLSYAEVARAVDCSETTARTRVHRGRREFRSAYAGGAESEPRIGQGEQNAS